MAESVVESEDEQPAHFNSVIFSPPSLDDMAGSIVESGGK